MTDAAMKTHATSRWRNFWKNLRVGYDHFETHRRPPNVIVKDGAYRFTDEP